MDTTSHEGLCAAALPVDNQLPLMTYRALGRHNTDESAFIAYRDLVFDITAFLSRHPGGRDIVRAALGTDITQTLDSFHDAHVSRLLVTERLREQYGIALAGKLSPLDVVRHNRLGLHDYQSRRQYPPADPMGDELRHEVFGLLRQECLPTQKSLAECLVLLALFYGALVSCVYLAFFKGSWLACLVFGPVATFMAVNVGHTVMHGGFSPYPFINLLGRCLWDAGGYAACCWDIEHQGHHQAPHTSIDLQTAPATGMRFFEHQRPKWFHRYQMFYMWLLFVFYSPVSWVMHSYKTLCVYPTVRPLDKALHVGFKLCFFIVPLTLSFWLLGVGVAARNLLVLSISMSYFSLFTLFIQHEDAYLPEEVCESWSVRQVVTSVSWRSGSAVFEWLFGYFNYHIEHHLFPGLNPSVYPRLQPLVKDICQKYGVRYKHISYLELVRSQLRAWRRYAIH